MKPSIFQVLPVGLFILSAAGCAVEAGSADEGVNSQSEELVSCPATSALDDQMRAAATVALTLMKDSSGLIGGWNNDSTPAVTILAPQRYRVQASGTGIEFDPTDELYGKVTNPMKAHLAFAQQDATVAKFLSDGLKYAYANTDGQVYPKINSVPALTNFKYPNTATTQIKDGTSNDGYKTVTVSGKSWCNSAVVTLSDVVHSSWQYSPMFSDQITLWRGTTPPQFKGTKHLPWTPFNGALASGNPYLIVSVNGSATNWATYNFTPVSCYIYSDFTCRGFIEIDPVPYAEPGDYYNSTGVVGTQSNPFPITSTVLYSSPDHQGQWATRTVNGIQEWGTFSNPLSLFGSTVYKYVKR
jgi:hypothetical protein